jgi:hypothetical protein
MIIREGKPRETARASVACFLLLGLAISPLVACGYGDGEGGEAEDMTPQEAEPLALGPLDGHDLPATDLERVTVGTMAPDFTLQTLGGETLTLSAFRGAKDVVLVVYRGHW